MSTLIRKVISVITGASLFLASLIFLSAAPAHAAYANDWTTAGLHEMARYMGQYEASTDGFGASAGSGNIDILKPTGATTVAAAYLTTGGRDHQGVVSSEPTVTLNNVGVTTYSARARIAGVSSPFQGDFTNYFADVTSIVQGYFSSSPTGASETAPWPGTKFSIPVSYQVANSNSLDDPAGVSLTVIFNNPTMTHDSSVVVYFGTSNSAGQDFQLDFQQLPNSQTGSWISFGIAWSAGGGQYSNIKAHNNLASAGTWNYLSGSAGGYDDGSSSGNNLITVGGVGDNTANPASAAAGDGQPDDELYNIDSLLATNVNQVTLNMTNPSGDDNIFGAVLNVPFILSGSGATQTHTVTYNAQGGSSDSVTNYLNTVNVFPADPTKAGSSFGGWYDSASYNVRVTAPYTPATFADITLYAKWDTTSHTITYDGRGGSQPANGSYTGTVNTLASDSVRAGYTFNGWFAAASGGSRITTPYTPTVFQDITLYAQWTQVASQESSGSTPTPSPIPSPASITHRVTYNSHGGSQVEGSTYEGSITLAGAPSRGGYKFLGWYENAIGGKSLKSPYTPSPEGDLVLHAQWSKVATLVVAGFADGSPALTSSTVAKIAAFVKNHSAYKKASCVGYTEGPTILKSDAQLSAKRGHNACALVTKLMKNRVTVSDVAAVQTKVESALNRRVKIVLMSR